MMGGFFLYLKQKGFPFFIVRCPGFLQKSQIMSPFYLLVSFVPANIKIWVLSLLVFTTFVPYYLLIITFAVSNCCWNDLFYSSFKFRNITIWPYFLGRAFCDFERTCSTKYFALLLESFVSLSNLNYWTNLIII